MIYIFITKKVSQIVIVIFDFSKAVDTIMMVSFQMVAGSIPTAGKVE